MSAKTVEIVPQSGTEIFIPLNKLKKSPNNGRKTPHSEAAIEAYAASIAAKGILQNLVVEPELDADSAATGFYFVTIGEGRRLAQLRFCGSSARRSKGASRSAASSTPPMMRLRLAWTKMSPGKTCTPPTSLKPSRSWRKIVGLARKKSPPGSASRRMWCGSAFASARSRQSWSKSTVAAIWRSTS
jgi:hypothetical protein